MTELVTKPDHGIPIGRIQKGTSETEVISTEAYQNFIDDLVLKLNGKVFGQAIILDSYTVATVPDATEFTGGMIFISDETGGAVPAFSDGTNWLRVTDRAVIS